MTSADVAGLMNIGGDVLLATKLVGALLPNTLMSRQAYETD